MRPPKPTNEAPVLPSELVKPKPTDPVTFRPERVLKVMEAIQKVRNNRKPAKGPGSS